MTKKPQKTDLQQEDHHPIAYGSMMLEAEEEAEKEKGEERQTASASCMAKKAISRRIAPTGGACRRPSGPLGGTPCRSRRVKAKGKGKDQGDGGKSKGEGKDQFFFKGQGKGVSALEYPDQEPYWSEESWSAEDGAWNPIAAVSKVRCNVSGAPCYVEKVPIRIMHKKNTAVNAQSTVKNTSKTHTTAEEGETKRRRRSRTRSQRKAGPSK